MSTLKVNKIENTSTTDGGIEIDSDGHVQLDGAQLPSAGPLSNRNIVINGAMQVAQRGTQATGVTGDDYRTCDRFRCVISSLGTWTIDQSTDAPEGFSSSLKLTCTTAATPSGSDLAIIHHRIEGHNLQQLKFGTANALSLTVSFWVKSNKTGDASFGMYQPDSSTRNVNNSYTINTANTWEYKTLTFAGDASGGINNDNGDGLVIEWWLNSGSDLIDTHQTTWNTYSEVSRNSSNLGVGGAVNDNFAITGVQLEVGDMATPFEHRSYGDELAKCQRYYYRWKSTQNSDVVCDMNCWGTNMALGQLVLPTSMRAVPDLSVSVLSDFIFSVNSNDLALTGISRNRATTESVQIYASGSGWSGLSAGDGGFLRDDQEHPSFMEFEAEL